MGTGDDVKGPTTARSAKVEQVLDSKTGRFDLRTRPSRAEAGMADGRDVVDYERRDVEPFHVDVLLPAGAQLALDADLVTFDSMLRSAPKTDDPNSMDISRRSLDPADARDRLLAAAERFHLDTASILAWSRRTASGAFLPTEPVPETPWMGTRIGYLTVEFKGSYLPSGKSASVDYALSWDGHDNSVAPSKTPKDSM